MDQMQYFILEIILCFTDNKLRVVQVLVKTNDVIVV